MVKPSPLMMSFPLIRVSYENFTLAPTWSSQWKSKDLCMPFFMAQVVKNMPYIIKVDKQGRLVLPKEVREKAGIKENSQLICTVIGERIILEHFLAEKIQEAFRRLEEIAPSLDLDVVEEVIGEDKYVDREYALRKIGFRRGN